MQNQITAAEIFADRPARIRRPQTAKWEPRLEGTPEEATRAQALIDAHLTGARS